VAVTSHLEPLELLYEAESLPVVELPAELRRLHAGDFGLEEPCLYANFVSTLDGVVAIPGIPSSNDLIAANSDADRFLMGLLRAFADVVLIGAGVLRASPRGTWQPERIYPPAADGYAELRRKLGRPEAPEVAVLTGSGSIDPAHPLLASGALVLTSDAGAARLDGRLPHATTIVELGSSTTIDPARVVEALHARGHLRILSEAGPHAFGSFLRAGVVDELFLTTSPLLVGDAGHGTRLRLVEASDLARAGIEGRLLGLRRHRSHLFLRYELTRTS
jgi:riboflavin biosynthesis pyrimidine reductase